MDNKKIFTWDDFEKYINDLVREISISGQKFDFVYGIPRGGMIPAVVLSHRLKIPMLQNPDAVPSNSSILIVDEICDSGKTLHKISNTNSFYAKDNNVSYKYAVLLTRHSATFKPDFSVGEIPDETWYYFPWESKFIERPKSWSDNFKPQLETEYAVH